MEKANESHNENLQSSGSEVQRRADDSEQQYGFMPGKSTTDTKFALRMLMEKF